MPFIRFLIWIFKTLKYSCFIMVIYVMTCNPYLIQNTLYILIEYIPWLTESIFYHANIIKENESASSLSLHFIENTKNVEITEANEKWWKEFDESREPFITYKQSYILIVILGGIWIVVRTYYWPWLQIYNTYFISLNCYTHY